MKTLPTPWLPALALLTGLWLCSCEFNPMSDMDLSGLDDFGNITIFPDGNPTWDLPSRPPYQGKDTTATVVYTLRASADNGDRTVVVGSHILASIDGEDYIDVSPNTLSFFNDVIWDGQRFLAVGRDGALAISSDGLDWTLNQGPADYDFGHVVRHDGLYIATAILGHSGQVILTSRDGLLWSERYYHPGENNAGDIVWIDGCYVVQGSTALRVATLPGTNLVSTTIVSSNGVDWEPHVQKPHLYVFMKLITFEDRLMALNRDGLLCSHDGLSWDLSHEFGPYNDEWFYYIAWSGERLVASNYPNFYPESASVFFVSTDGVTWTKVEGVTSHGIADLRWSCRNFVAVGDDLIMTSVDGLSWTEGSLPILEDGVTSGI